MLNLGFKKEVKVKRERKDQKRFNSVNRVNLDVKKVLESADQKLIVMVRN